MIRWTSTRLQLLLFASSILLGIGLFAPTMTIVPRYGEFTSLVKILNSDYSTSHQFSIAKGIWSLFCEGQIFIGLILFVFSVLFPLWKLGALWVSAASLSTKHSSSKGLNVIERLGKFSMIDIFVIALLVLAVKGLPGGSEVEINWGIYFFAGSVLLTIKIPHWIKESQKKTIQLP